MDIIATVIELITTLPDATEVLAKLRKPVNFLAKGSQKGEMSEACLAPIC